MPEDVGYDRFYQNIRGVDTFLKRHFGISQKGNIERTFKFFDRITWDRIFTSAKLHTFLTSLNKGKNAIQPGDTQEQLYKKARRAAQFTNDAYGGQNWAQVTQRIENRFVKNLAQTTLTPGSRGYLQLLLFAPDWTISNIRIAFRGMGMTKDLVTKVAKGGKLNAKEIAEWHQYAGYFVRGLITTSMLAYMASAFMSDEDTPLDLKDFWLRGRVNLGGGEEMVVSKQIAEPMHWLMHPLQTGLNKSATLPKTVAEIFLGKQYISLKHSGYIGPNMDRSNPKEVLSYMAGKLPISVSPWKRLITDDNYTLTDANKAAVLGALGFPIYKRTGD